MAEDETALRKDSHLDLCASDEVEPSTSSTLLECVHLVHCAMPEMAIDEVELSGTLWGKSVRAPVVVTGMTGGTERAAQVNRDLATLAERHGLIFGVGSQRAMSEDLARAKSFRVRDVAPTTVVLGNVGLSLAAQRGPSGVRELVEDIGADGVALHLNAAQELTQPEGDRDFRGGYGIVEKLAQEFGERLWIKETGCGLSPVVASRLVALGVKHLDVSGVGGTSWVRVEQLRARGVAAQVGEQFSSWGIPTAAAIASVRRRVGPDVKLVASGGIRTGLDAAKAIALGADWVGMALPLFRAQQEGGTTRAEAVLESIMRGLRQAFVLTGNRTVAQLRRSPRVVTGDLKDWLAAI
jgi:isopentenyl-diphosphate Delta-isomerase